MLSFRGFLAICLLACAFSTVAQTNELEKQPRILILLDGSSSMGSDWGGSETRFNAASKVILTLMDSLYKVNKNVEFALRVYGHQSPAQNNDCYDTKLEVMFSKDNLTQMSLRLAALRAIGVSPIAFSLKEAAEHDLVDLKRNTYSLILITDGEESCGGNICDVAKELLDKSIDFKPYILSLVDNTALKTQYSCLGDYLAVTNEKDIKPTVGKIVEAYRPMLTLTTIQRKLIAQAVVNAPSAMNVSIPKFEVRKEEDVVVPVKPPTPAPKPRIETPEVKRPEIKLTTPQATPVTDIKLDIPATEITSLSPRASTRSFPVRYTTPNFFTKQAPPYNPAPIKNEEIVAATPPPVVKTPPVVKAPPVVAPPVVKPPVPAPPKPVEKKPVPQPDQAITTKPKELKYTQTSEPSTETTLQVYFTDGRGTFYHTDPELVLRDPKTKEPIQKFNRTVDASGKPDMQKVAPGTYALTITGKNNYIITDVKVDANKNNAINIPVSEGSIIFAYDNNQNRPVDDYVATVYHRFSSAAIVKQKCTQELFYEPGTYHVEVNTLPPFKRTLYLNFGEQYQVEIPEEGDLVITNTNNIGKVFFLAPLGDQFTIFYSLNVTGNPEGYKLRLLPGTYKAKYKLTPNSEETVIQFRITSNNVTNLEFK